MLHYVKGLLQDAVKAFIGVNVYGFKWLHGWRKQKGKKMSSLVVFFDRAIVFSQAQFEDERTEIPLWEV